MTDIPDDIMAKAREVLDELGLPTWYHSNVFIISAALLSERTAQEAEIARLKNKLVAAWNAFGPPSPRTEKPVFDVDDLDHLSRSADGELDEQIRALEDQFAASKARVAEALGCLDGEPEYHYQGMGCGLEDRSITDRYEAMHYGWEEALERVYSEHIIPARAALTPAKENTDAG